MGINNELLAIGIFFGLLGILFLIMTYFVLRNGMTEINIVFSVSTLLFALGSFLCSMDFSNRAIFNPPLNLPSFIPDIGTLAYLWAPLGILFAGKFILHGIRSWKEITSLGILGLFILITIIYIVSIAQPILINATGPTRGTWFGTIVISFALLIALFEYFQIYTIASDLRLQISYLLGGIMLGILGLFAVLFSSGNVNVLPQEFQPEFALLINVGVLLAAFSFTNIPQHLRINLGLKSGQIKTSL